MIPVNLYLDKTAAAKAIAVPRFSIARGVIETASTLCPLRDRIAPLNSGKAGKIGIGGKELASMLNGERRQVRIHDQISDGLSPRQ